MRVLSLFSGIGAFEKALENLGVSYELVNYCEIDKYASKAYSLIHNVSESKNLKDVREVKANKLKDLDLITYGFPCQDISLAGNQKGFTDENGNTTRSGLFFEALRIIDKTRPKIAIAENVKALVSQKFDTEFKVVLGSLNRLGYNNYFQVLNAKDYGIPQNRDRVFIVSIRQDIDKGFTFPEKQELGLTMADLLEDNVGEDYFLTEKVLNSFLNHKKRHQERGNGFKFEPRDGSGVATTILTTAGSRPTDNFIMVNNATKKGYVEAHIGDLHNLQYANSKTRRGRVNSSVANTLLCNDQNGVVTNNLRIRKLTPKECFRLMGFEDKDIDILVANNISRTQLFKMAGNSIVVNVVYHIFKELKRMYPDLFAISKKDVNQVSIDDVLEEV